MWAYILTISSLTSVVLSDLLAPGFDRTVSDGVKSTGFKVLYGDEDLTVINSVINDEEKSPLKSVVNLNDAIKPLPAQDVKCLMSVDRYCSKEMGQIKGVLIQALKNDCEKCSDQEKDDAGKVAAAMLAHDSIAWKLFLTRSTLQIRTQEDIPEKKDIKLKSIGEPEDILSGSNRFIMPGVKVRVKRYVAEEMPKP